MYWYVLFVRTGYEYKVSTLIGKYANKETFSPFIPLVASMFKKAGVLKKELKILFPGYVFIESKLADRDFVDNIKPILGVTSQIIHLVRYSDTEVAMRESEKQTLVRLFDENRCIEVSQAISEGDRIQIVHGPLMGLGEIVKRVNRHKRVAWIEVAIMGDIRLVNVPLEIVERR